MSEDRILLARQPIFDADAQVVAYEFLFRGEWAVGGSAATAQVLVESLSAFELEDLSGGLPVFVNFTQELLLGDHIPLFSPEQLVVEILEDVPATPEVLATCDRLRAQGYTLALDDVVHHRRLEAFAGRVDLVKLDWLEAEPSERARILGDLRGVRALAEKIESREDLEEALRHGCTLFQGFFFARPEGMRARSPSSFKSTHLDLLRVLQRPSLPMGAVVKVVRRDLALTLRLLRFVNSVWYQRRQAVSSVERAIALLGERKARQWLTLVTLASLAEDQPAELLTTALLRAHFCEQVCDPRRVDVEPFMIGLLSVADVLLGRSMAWVVDELSLSLSMARALLDGPGRGHDALRLVVAWERGRWTEVDDLGSGLGLHHDELLDAYLRAAVRATHVDVGGLLSPLE